MNRRLKKIGDICNLSLFLFFVGGLTTPSPTPKEQTPTPPPITPSQTPTPIPAYEAISAIAGLLAVAYLLRRRK